MIRAPDVIMTKTKHTFVNLQDMNHTTTGQHIREPKFKETEVIQDIYYPNKQYGHITLQSFQFEFIGPERPMVTLNSVESFIETAEIILKTGLPNYITEELVFLLTVVGRHGRLILKIIRTNASYNILDMLSPSAVTPNKRHSLRSTLVTNHFSAKEYPKQVQSFLQQEIDRGAIMGPFDTPPHPDLHCSPLLTRPKDNNDRRIVLDLSYPKGKSLNNMVNKEVYDGIAYRLKFPNTDHICEAIARYEDPYISKIDISGAFRQLRIDPADALKLGITWNGQYFIDLYFACGYVHGSGIYTLLSQLIEHIMRSKGHEMIGYLDDYIIMFDYRDAGIAFRTLCDLLTELGLPINSKKVCPLQSVCRALVYILI